LIRAFVLDDEELAVRRLCRMLAETGVVEVIGSATDPVSAVEALKASAPDVLFLDIQMPGLNGFEFLQELGNEQPLIVFTTAYQEYALKAFEVNSIDYLLKPVERQQLDRALAKVERMRGSSEPRADVNDLLRKLASALNSKHPDYPARMPSRTGDRVEFVDLTRVTHFYAKDKLTFAATPAKDYCVDGSIADLEAKLDPKRFIRIHRSTLVNLEFVQELYSWFGGRVLIRLRDDKHTELTVARDRVKELKDKLDL
jgi:two-component system, LytTR family, response regulator